MKKTSLAVAKTAATKTKLSRQDVINVLVELDAKRHAQLSIDLQKRTADLEAQLLKSIRGVALRSMKAHSGFIKRCYEGIQFFVTVGKNEPGFPKALYEAYVKAADTYRPQWNAENSRKSITQKLEAERLAAIMSNKELVSDIETIFAKICGQ